MTDGTERAIISALRRADILDPSGGWEQAARAAQSLELQIHGRRVAMTVARAEPACRRILDLQDALGCDVPVVLSSKAVTFILREDDTDRVLDVLGQGRSHRVREGVCLFELQEVGDQARGTEAVFGLLTHRLASYGVTIEEVISSGQRLFLLVPAEDRSRAREALRSVITGKDGARTHHSEKGREFYDHHDEQS